MRHLMPLLSLVGLLLAGCHPPLPAPEPDVVIVDAGREPALDAGRAIVDHGFIDFDASPDAAGDDTVEGRVSVCRAMCLNLQKHDCRVEVPPTDGGLILCTDVCNHAARTHYTNLKPACVRDCQDLVCIRKCGSVDCKGGK